MAEAVPQQFLGLPVGITQAVIQILGVAATAAVTYFVWHRNSQRDDLKAAEQREERISDILVALRAEVAVDLERLERIFGEAFWPLFRRQKVANLAEDRPQRDTKDMPQAPVVDDHFIFESIKDDLSLLPVQFIDPVVRYYRHDKFLNALEQQMADGMFEGLSDARQTEAIDEYIDLGWNTLIYARDLFAALEMHVRNNNLHVTANSVEGSPSTEFRPDG